MWPKLSKNCLELVFVGLATIGSMFLVHNFFDYLKISPSKTPIYTSSPSASSPE